MAAPIADGTPFRLDIATTAVAGGKLEIAGRQSKPLPEGWAVDEDGNHSDDPYIMRKNGALLPLGSTLTTSSHKGYGLGLMVDIMSGVLSGDGSGLFAPRGQNLIQGQWFAAWRIDLFCEPDEFKSSMKEMADAIREIEPLDGVERVVIPGDPEEIARADRSANGIPLDQETIEQLIALANNGAFHSRSIEQRRYQMTMVNARIDAAIESIIANYGRAAGIFDPNRLEVWKSWA